MGKRSASVLAAQEYDLDKIISKCRREMEPPRVPTYVPPPVPEFPIHAHLPAGTFGALDTSVTSTRPWPEGRMTADMKLLRIAALEHLGYAVHIDAADWKVAFAPHFPKLVLAGGRVDVKAVVALLGKDKGKGKAKDKAKAKAKDEAKDKTALGARLVELANPRYGLDDFTSWDNIRCCVFAAAHVLFETLPTTRPRWDVEIGVSYIRVYDTIVHPDRIERRAGIYSGSNQYRGCAGVGEVAEYLKCPTIELEVNRNGY